MSLWRSLSNSEIKTADDLGADNADGRIVGFAVFELTALVFVKITERLRRAQDKTFCFVAYVLTVGQRLGGGGNRNARKAGNLLKCHKINSV